MAGDGYGNVVTKTLKCYFGCGVCKWHFLVPNMRGGIHCAQILDRKRDGYFTCGVCDGNFVFPDTAWQGMFVQKCGQKTRWLFGCGICKAKFWYNMSWQVIVVKTLWTGNSLVILSVLYVKNICRVLIKRK